jgi:phosphoenolpyruvate carboxylase
MGSADRLMQSMQDRLERLRGEIKTDPLRNPVRELAHELSRALEAQEHDLGDLEALIERLDREAFASRAEHVSAYLAGAEIGEAPLARAVETLSEPLIDFASFDAFWSHRQETLVFTGHPTFLLSLDARRRLADEASRNAVPARGAGLPDSPITLDFEHEQAEAALRTAADAVYRLNRSILAYAQKAYPDEWLGMEPGPIGLGTWVGYDMDGRTDIGWEDVIRHRLHEKQLRLGLYVERLKAVGEPVAPVTDTVEAAWQRTQRYYDAFCQDLTDPETLAKAANLLTEGPEPLVSVEPLIARLTAIAASVDADTALEIAAIRADMRLFGLGMGDVHFRLNASQIRNAARAILPQGLREDLFSRGALESISKSIETVEPIRVNFRSLAGERGAAARLFIAMAQILKHIDADTPIRLLIAECENPVTVLAAIYQARYFDIAGQVDICPLFETALSLDRGRRILDVLLGQPAFQAHVKARGRVAIETGFSDAGRFMGQVPAALAIERLHAQFADELAHHGLQHLRAIIYDTHGESMGRGGHPGGIVDRCLYALSPWARQQFRKRSIPLSHEQSFQGGDGYIWFTNDHLAERTLTGILLAGKAASDVGRAPDPFYLKTSASLDFFNSVKRRQEALFVDPAYNIALGALGLALLPQTGSRKSRRQFDRQTDEETSLRRIRAIPHNAILQQLGFLANILGGVGNALAVEPEALRNLRQNSDRFDRIMRMVNRARAGSDMKTLIAYMNLYSGSFWATRPITGQEAHLEMACATLAQHLADDQRYFAGLQLAARLRSDSIALSRAFALMDFHTGGTSGHTDPQLDLLHAVRIALIQHVFLLAADLPAHTPRGTFSRQDVMDAVLSLDIEGAVAILREAFPHQPAGLGDAAFAEPADAERSDPFFDVGRTEALIDELETVQRLIHRITVGIANHFGAIG